MCRLACPFFCIAEWTRRLRAIVKELINDIKTGQFKRVYLLYGDESYLKLQYRKRLVDALISEEDQMNHTVYEGDHIEEGALIDQAETMPFFADRRVIEVNRSGFFKSGCEKLPEYIKSLPDYLVLVFTENEVDKRSRLFKAVKDNGRVVEFGEQKESALEAWILKMLSTANLKIRKQEMDYLLERTGSDMNHIRLEMDKLIHYCQEKEIEVISGEIIREVITERTENRIFDMVSAVTSKRRQAALDLYTDLLALKEPPMRILYLIGRQFHQLLVIKELSMDGVPASQIASKAGMPPFAVRKQMDLIRQYQIETLKTCIRRCVEAEEAVKSGRMNDRLAVELILIELSR